MTVLPFDLLLGFLVQANAQGPVPCSFSPPVHLPSLISASCRLHLLSELVPSHMILAFQEVRLERPLTIIDEIISRTRSNAHPDLKLDQEKFVAVNITRRLRGVTTLLPSRGKIEAIDVELFVSFGESFELRESV